MKMPLNLNPTCFWLRKDAGSDRNTSAVVDATDRVENARLWCDKEGVAEETSEYRIVVTVRTRPDTMVSSWFSVLLTKADEGFGSDA